MGQRGSSSAPLARARPGAGLSAVEGGLESTRHTRRSLLVREYAFTCDFARGFLNARCRISLKPVMIDREIQHFADEREHTVRHDGRTVGDVLDQRPYVAAGQIAHGLVAPGRKHVGVQDAFVFVG